MATDFEDNNTYDKDGLPAFSFDDTKKTPTSKPSKTAMSPRPLSTVPKKHRFGLKLKQRKRRILLVAGLIAIGIGVVVVIVVLALFAGSSKQEEGPVASTQRKNGTVNNTTVPDKEYIMPVAYITAGTVSVVTDRPKIYCKITDAWNIKNITISKLHNDTATPLADLFGHGAPHIYNHSGSSNYTLSTGFSGGNLTVTLEFNSVECIDGGLYQCKLTDAENNVVYSNTSELTVLEIPHIKKLSLPIANHAILNEKTGMTCDAYIDSYNDTIEWFFRDDLNIYPMPAEMIDEHINTTKCGKIKKSVLWFAPPYNATTFECRYTNARTSEVFSQNLVVPVIDGQFCLNKNVGLYDHPYAACDVKIDCISQWLPPRTTKFCVGENEGKCLDINTRSCY